MTAPLKSISLLLTFPISSQGFLISLHLHSFAVGALYVALSLVQPAMAQAARTPIGEVNATIGSDAYSGVTLQAPSEGTATANFRRTGPSTQLSIQAHDPKAKRVLHRVLTVEIALMGSDSSAGIAEATVSWWPAGMRKPFYHSEGSEAELDVSVDTLSLDGDAPSVSGSFSARLCRKDAFHTTPDATHCVPVKGTFKTALQKER